MIWKVFSLLWLGAEAWLSHQPGERSAEQSKWLAARSGADERWLRKAAHVLCFAVLALLGCLGFGPWALPSCASWAALDELTKKPIRGRHCSSRDIRRNLLGTAIGGALWLIGRFLNRKQRK